MVAILPVMSGEEERETTGAFGRWLRIRIAWLALVAAVVLLAWGLVRPCEGETGCSHRDDLFILLPVLPLALIGGVTLLGEWRLSRRDGDASE